jgi:hypothetical protein
VIPDEGRRRRRRGRKIDEKGEALINSSSEPATHLEGNRSSGNPTK